MSWLAEFDAAAATLFSGLNGEAFWIDRLFGPIFALATLKISFFVILLGALWMACPQGKEVRRGVIAGACGGTLAMFLTHLVQHLAPDRLRPWQSGYPFQKAITEESLDASSFPSDTVGLACALAFGIFVASRRWGMVACLWVLIVDVGGKLFSGDHYPSDIVAGAVIGLASTGSFLVWKQLTTWLDGFAFNFQKRHPLPFFIAFFFMAVQLSTLFDDLRAIGNAMLSRNAFAESVQKPVASKQMPIAGNR